MKVSELGEFGLIELLARTISQSTTGKSLPQLILGIGDDAAAWHSEGAIQMATTDTLVDGTHFNIAEITWEELGWKSIAVNLSDIAAMGGVPKYALVTLAIPQDALVENIVSLYKGMLEIASSYGVAIVGGDTVKSPVTTITVSLFGVIENDAGKMMTRSVARPGDVIAVTGFLGSSAAGLKMLRETLCLPEETEAYLRKAHFKPQPRVSEGQKMAQAGVRCAIDISDGLVGDLGHICEMSRVGARIRTDDLPIHPLVKASFPKESPDLALSGGEDYELLFTANTSLARQIQNTLSIPVTLIGEITKDKPGQVVLIDRKGNSFPWRRKGWDHFSTPNAENH